MGLSNPSQSPQRCPDGLLSSKKEELRDDLAAK
jgi:hypothetical protein